MADSASPYAEPHGTAAQGDHHVQKKQKRSRAGCLTCRADKKKCDEVHPLCSRCAKLKYDCVWPGDSAGSTPRERWRPAPRRSAARNAGNDQSQSQSRSPSAAAAPPRSTFNVGMGDLAADSTHFAVPDAPASTSAKGLDFDSIPFDQPWVPTFSQNEAVLTEAELSEIFRDLPQLEGLPGTLSFWQNTALYGLGGGDRSSAGSPAYSPIQHSSSSGSPFPSAASGGSAAAPAMPPATSQISSHPPMSSDLQRLLHQPKQPQPAQQPQQQDAPPASTAVPAKRRSREERVRISKAELQSVSACLPKSVFALIERVISEQEGEKEAVLPLSYLVNMGMWLDRHTLSHLIKHLEQCYSEDPRLLQIIDGWDISGQAPTPPVNELITVNELWDMPNLSIDAKMSAAVDLTYRHYCVGGAEHYYDTLAVFDKYLSTIFRPNKAINIGMLTNPSHYGMSCYVLADIVRSVALGYPTAFPYVFQPTTTHALTGTEFLNGSSDIINILLTDVSNLKFLLERDASSRSEDGLLSEMYQKRADTILRGIRAFKPYSLGEQEEHEDDSLAHVSGVTVQELWRQATLIHFYQSIYRSPATFEPLQKCMRQIIKLMEVLAIAAPLRPAAILCLPVFLAASVAVEKDARETLIGHLSGFDTVLGFKQNKDLVQLIWSESDRLGAQVDWRDYASPTRGPAFL